MVTLLDRLPSGFLSARATRLHRLVPEPTLIRLTGRAESSLFVVVLQHGNEDTGLSAVQRLLSRYERTPLPRPLWLFIANPQAARFRLRRLDRQPDLNRCWPGTPLSQERESQMLREVVETVLREPLLASVDIHNTSGRSPHHAGINRLDPRFVQLAHWFAPTLVYFDRPPGAQSLALAPYCPAVTLECGPPGSAHAAEHARRFLQHCLEVEAIPRDPVPAPEVGLYRSLARVFVREDVDFDFGYDSVASLALDPEIDRLNFRDLAAGTVLARSRTTSAPVRALGAQGADLTGDLFAWNDGLLRLRRRLMPSLLSRDRRVVRDDCLGQLMENMPLPRGEHA